MAVLDLPSGLAAPPAPPVTVSDAPPAPAVLVAPGEGSGSRRGPVGRFWRGKETDPPWVRPALLGLLAATAVLYLWGLGACGWANTFYSAAVQAGTKSWKAFFFGSSDASNFITVDKPPAVSVGHGDLGPALRPQCVEHPRPRRPSKGVATVGLLYADGASLVLAAGRRSSAGAVVALTPVAALMFRYNNPDAMLVLLLDRGRLCHHSCARAAETRWLVLAGAWWASASSPRCSRPSRSCPPSALVYLLAAPTRSWRRVRQLA